MTRSYKARNKRVIKRSGNGRFRRATGADFGIGICTTNGCGGLTVRVYDGDENDEFPDPRKFRQRCYHCEPKTDEELAQERALTEAASRKSGFEKMLEDAIKADS